MFASISEVNIENINAQKCINKKEIHCILEKIGFIHVDSSGMLSPVLYFRNISKLNFVPSIYRKHIPIPHFIIFIFWIIYIRKKR